MLKYRHHYRDAGYPNSIDGDIALEARDAAEHLKTIIDAALTRGADEDAIVGYVTAEFCRRVHREIEAYQHNNQFGYITIRQRPQR